VNPSLAPNVRLHVLHSSERPVVPCGLKKHHTSGLAFPFPTVYDASSCTGRKECTRCKERQGQLVYQISAPSRTLAPSLATLSIENKKKTTAIDIMCDAFRCSEFWLIVTCLCAMPRCTPAHLFCSLTHNNAHVEKILRAPRKWKCMQVIGVHQSGRGAHFAQSFRCYLYKRQRRPELGIYTASYS
jgi:hypothetical protein